MKTDNDCTFEQEDDCASQHDDIKIILVLGEHVHSPLGLNLSISNHDKLTVRNDWCLLANLEFFEDLVCCIE